MSIGKDLENDVAKVLTKAPGVRFHRFADAHAAGRFMNTQPADFVVWAHGTSMLLECKESASDVGIMKKIFNGDSAKAQLASMKLVIHTGNKALFLFRNPVLGIVETIPANGIDLNNPRTAWVHDMQHASLEEALQASIDGMDKCCRFCGDDAITSDEYPGGSEDDYLL